MVAAQEEVEIVRVCRTVGRQSPLALVTRGHASGMKVQVHELMRETNCQ